MDSSEAGSPPSTGTVTVIVTVTVTVTVLTVTVWVHNITPGVHSFGTHCISSHLSDECILPKSTARGPIPNRSGVVCGDHRG